MTAEQLQGGDINVEVFERAPNIGGHSRSETLNGVVYEPNGAPIFHTSNAEVGGYVQRFGLFRPYGHAVKAEVHVGDDDAPTLLSWPPQVSELRELAIWPTVGRLFRDAWEFFPPNGVNSVVERVLSSVSVTCGAGLVIDDLVGMQPTSTRSW